MKMLAQMAKILAKRWKDCRAKRPASLLSVDDMKRHKAQRKARAQEHRQRAEDVREKKREYFQMLRQKKEDKQAKKV